MHKVIISLGSNINDKFKYLNDAKYLISKFSNILKESSFMITEALGGVTKEDFLNQIILIETSLSPEDLLSKLKDIEKKIGRVERKRWDKREIDIDIITYEGIIKETNTLTIPHKEILNRKFIVLGSYEICPNYVVEKINLSFKDIKDKYIERLDNQRVDFI